MRIDGYRPMWVIAMFDLPTDTPAARREYAQFRKSLIRDGFLMMQFSVYIRNTASRENAEVHMQRVAQAVPANGEVRVLVVTDAQFSRMQVFWGKRRKPTEQPPSQLELF